MKKYIIYFLITITIVILLFSSCKPTDDISENLSSITANDDIVEQNKEYTQSYIGSENVAKIEKYGKYGLINQESNEIVAPPIYDDIENFSDGLAIAKIEGESRYIDDKGNNVRWYVDFELWSLS